MSPAVVKPPAPRKTAALPWIAIAVGSALGLALFVVLWQVAVEVQKNNTPQAPPQTWESPKQ
jgi:hypothetical protein